MKAIALATLALVSATAQAEVIDQSSSDITVLKAFDTGKTLGAYGGDIDFSLCTPLSNDSYPKLDCTVAVETAIAQRYPEIVAPLAGQVIVYGSRSESGGWNVSQFYCKSLEIQTLTQPAALQAASGVGFYFDGTTRVIPVSKLQKIGQATLKDGSLRDVHRFQASAFCWRGSATSSSMSSYAFRPFLEYSTTEGRLYRNWDSVPSNYIPGRVGGYMGRWETGFDRSTELLK